MSKYASFDTDSKWARTETFFALSDLAQALFGWLG